MKQLLFLLLFPSLALAQYQGNANQKITLGEQTTADGLVWRGLRADTTSKIVPFSDTSAYIILDTVEKTLWLYKAGQLPKWQQVGGSAGSGGVTSFSAGSTGLTPSTATTGAVTLGGTLAVANGGTGSATKNFVDLTTEQSVNGVKTFLDTIIVNKGIRFPATQSASTNAHTLDDYEEGIFTPSWVSSGATFVYDAAYRHGRYTKIGNTVYVSFHISTTEIPGGTITNALTISGLPFNSGNVDNSHFSAFNYGYLYNIDWPANKTQATAIMNRNGSAVAMQWEQDSTASGQWLASALRAGSYLIINGFYFVP